MLFDSLGRLLIVVGLVLVGVGGLFLLAGRLPWLGRLPGDFTFTRDNLTISVPIATSILLSLLLTLVLSLLARR